MDKIYRCMLDDGRIRIFLADTSNACKEICERHNLNTTSSDALSRVLSISAIMGIMQKAGKLTIKVEANGPLKGILCDVDYEGNIRGLVYNSSLNEEMPVEKAIGDKGLITVIRDLEMRVQNFSETELISGKIGEDFSYYFKESEQVPSVVLVGSQVDKHEFISGALILQLMPGYKEENVLYAEHFALQAPKLVDIIKTGDLEGALKELFPDIQIFSTHDVKFKCNCEKGRFIAGLATLPLKDIQEIVNDNKPIEVTCNFCNRKYQLDTSDQLMALNMRLERDTKKNA